MIFTLNAMATAVVTAADMVAGHVSLDISCLDRLYLTRFVPSLQTPGGVVYLLYDHRRNPIPGTVTVWFERWMAKLPPTADLHRPRRRILVTAVDAPDRGLPHPGLRRRLLCPRLLRTDAGRPENVKLIFRRGQRLGRPTDPPPGGGGFRQRSIDDLVTLNFVLQKLTRQAVPQRRAGNAHRNRRQRPP